MEKKDLKLNYKNTFYIGCAFFSILMLWNVYNTYCSSFLADLLGTGEDDYIIGVIMAADNFFALFMLPIFGVLSDKTRSRFGKRMPYIVVGMILAALLFPLIAVFFIKRSLIGVIVMMGVILIIMNFYRSPAVALMPDVTPKPLRSKANGIINLVGYLGAIIAGGLAMVFSYETDSLITFVVASLFMLIAVIILVTKIKENRLVEENKEAIRLGEEMSQSLEIVEEGKALSKLDKINLFILLGSIFLWFMSFNAIETFISIYCTDVLKDFNISGTITIVMTVSSILTFLPSGNLANRIGRKRSILIGIGTMISAFIIIILLTRLAGDNILVGKNKLIMLVSIALCGIGWALINVNSYPMMVEMSAKNNIGKFTGYYYTSSMVAQTVTPILIGLIMSFNNAGRKLLFPYSLIIMILAFITFVFFKENKKAVKKIKKGLEALDVDD